MPSITKYGKRWRAQVAVKGSRASKIFDTKNQASLWAIEQETIFKNGNATVSGYRLRNAFARYAREVSPTKKGERWEVVRLRKLSRDALAEIFINRIQASDIQGWIDRQTISPGSVIRELNLIQSVFKHARKWRWTNFEFTSEIEWPKSPPHRERLITDSEVQSLLSVQARQVAKKQPFNKTEQVKIVFQIALETAMRKSEILGLQWDHVHLDRRFVHLPVTKNGKSRNVPLSKKAIILFGQCEQRETGKVFTVTSDSFDQLFRKMKSRAGVEGFTFHDTRHTAVTRLAKKVPVLQLARMVGHSDPRSLMWYYNETAEELAALLD